MQKRAFGIETEYSVAIKTTEKNFLTFIPNVGEATDFIRRVFPLKNDAPQKLKDLMLFPQVGPDKMWLASNGGYFYFDVGLKIPEYATPECSSPRESVIHSWAGDIILELFRKEALRLEFDFERHWDKLADINVFKMVTHFDEREDIRTQDATGCHENYQTLAELVPIQNHNNTFPFVEFMVPFLMTRQIFDGAGGVIRKPENKWHYIISQRPLFIKQKYGAGTMLSPFDGAPRGYIHFRNESNNENEPEHTRLHLHCGDTNMSPWGKLTAMGATHLVLRAFEENRPVNWKFNTNMDYFLEDILAITSDPFLKSPVHLLKSNTKVKRNALEVQQEYLEFVEKVLKNLTEEESEMLALWKRILTKLKNGYEEVATELDWAIKLNFINEELGGDLKSAKTRFASALYHDISEKGIYNILLRSDKITPFFQTGELDYALQNPPKTRAQFRSRYLKTLLKKRKNDISYYQWGIFPNVRGSHLIIQNTLTTTTEEGEIILKELEAEKN